MTAREVLAIEINTSLSAKRMKRVSDRVMNKRGKPARIWVDNGPEFTSNELKNGQKRTTSVPQYTQTGRAVQNGFTERFNRLYREVVLVAYPFFELYEVRLLTSEWIRE